MNLRKLNILIVVLYAVSAFCLLGMGSVRKELEELRAAETAQQVSVTESAGPEEQLKGSPYALQVEELENKLTIWQVVAMIIFAMASLLLIFKDKLIRHIPPPAK